MARLAGRPDCLHCNHSRRGRGHRARSRILAQPGRLAVLPSIISRPIREERVGARRRLQGLAVALALSLSAWPAMAGTVTAIEAVQATPRAYPGSETGAMRDWVQLVWDPVSSQLRPIA